MRCLSGSEYQFGLTYLLMPCPFTGPKMFWASPNFLSHSKNLIAFSASSKTFVPTKKIKFAERKSSFGVAQNVCDWHKHKMYINFWSGPKKFDQAKIFWDDFWKLVYLNGT